MNAGVPGTLPVKAGAVASGVGSMDVIMLVPGGLTVVLLVLAADWGTGFGWSWNICDDEDGLAPYV